MKLLREYIRTLLTESIDSKIMSMIDKAEEAGFRALLRPGYAAVYDPAIDVSDRPDGYVGFVNRVAGRIRRTLSSIMSTDSGAPLLSASLKVHTCDGALTRRPASRVDGSRAGVAGREAADSSAMISKRARTMGTVLERAWDAIYLAVDEKPRRAWGSRGGRSRRELGAC